MNAELQKLVDEGIAVDNLAVWEIYRSRTSDEFSEDWSNLFERLRSPEFAASSAGVPTLDRRVEVDDFADDFDTSPEWAFAENCVRFTQEQSELIAQARKLAAVPEPTYFEIDFQSGDTLLPDVQSTRTVAWSLRTDSQVAMYLGDENRAFEDIVAIFGLSKNVDAVPCLVSRLAGIAVRRIGMQSLQNAIRLDLLRDDQLLEIDRLLTRYHDIDDRWQSLMIDEMSFHLPVFINPNLSMKTETFIPARGHDAVYFIDLMRRAAAIPCDDWSRLYHSSNELEMEFRQGLKSTLTSVDRIFTGVFMPPFETLAASLINDAQLHRQARIAIALRLYQHNHKKFPSTLGELPETVTALTPYGKKPFGYTCDDTQAVLWGFWLSPEQQQTLEQVPDTEQPNTDSSNDRQVVWRLDVHSK